ncbi:branched-chain amino acid ABC transporter permease [Mesorhizobium microcysteis]|uniref:Branched-chain amino acid ABC transporter permease n=1 Tax=Neoaquamicrobium microcysteis TaxID=2682781 RepID=A0A5D4GXD8_9HYPH|nr:branched-chain amino acid ABC transporter permease [Mesorhizobium microcysteis]TYR33531.1 branched-chain amino acid ABC transporter permease [Mesorhizobium microcysteis]
MIEFVNSVANGVLIGLLYALVAMGFVVIYRASKVFNFAQGELIVFSAFLMWAVVIDRQLPLWIGLPVTFIGAAICGYVLDRLFLSRLVGESVFSMVMITVGLLILMRGLIIIIWGAETRAFPVVFPLRPVIVGDIIMSQALVIGGVITIVLAFGLSWFFNHTRTGLALTAVSEDQQVALSLGISVRKSMSLAWIIGALISAIAACVYLSGRSLNLHAADIAFAALPVALLAGLESITGLIVAGALVGVAQSLAQYYLDPWLGLNIASVVPFILILLILLIRPSGLFGWKTIERV